MLIQIIENNKRSYDAAHFKWFKDTVAASVNLHGLEKLDWLHAEAIDFNCDVFFKLINTTQVQVGFVCSDIKVLESEEKLHWVTIEMLGEGSFDALTQILLVTIGTGCIPSVTGGFSTDWADIRTVLSHGTKAFCIEFNWDASQQTIMVLEEAMRDLQYPVEIMSCAMLLNQGLRIKQTFENIQNLMSGSGLPESCLMISNVTDSELISRENLAMLVFKTKNNENEECQYA